MAVNPLRMLKHRLSAAIDWRVKKEFEQERQLFVGVAESVTDISITYAGQIAELLARVDNLEKRIEHLDK